jgi:RNA 2',3'-cyclic 3'-phosphodiesterase
MPSLRLFIAIKTPPNIIPQIAAIRDKLRASSAHVKWEPDEKLHATLKFLGNADERLLPEIVLCIRGVGLILSPLFLKYKGVGCFPNQRAPKVIWVGIEDLNGSLNSLQEKIESEFVPLGFEREMRKFHAHVTLGRVKDERMIQSLLRTMESITFESQPAAIQEIALIKSELKPSGSVYTTLNTFPLQG